MIFTTLMRNKCFCLLIVSSLFYLLSSCNPALTDANDEGALKDLPHFEYLGYTYYIHPHLAIHSLNMTNGGNGYAYKDWEREVNSLDSYGCNTWFIPTVSELLEAAQLGLLQKEYGYFSSDGQRLFFDLLGNHI